MDKSDLIFYKKLNEEKGKIIESLESLSTDKNESIDMYYTENSGYDNHPADIGTEVYMMEQDKGMKNKLKNTLSEIEESLEDINNGTYGICNKCNKEINKERLELIPYLKTCIECSSELSVPVDYRQLSDERISGNLFGTTKKDHAYFDGEDTLQQVVQYNIVENDPSSSTGDNMGVMDEENEGVEPVENISQEYYNQTLK